MNRRWLALGHFVAMAAGSVFIGLGAHSEAIGIGSFLLVGGAILWLQDTKGLK